MISNRVVIAVIVLLVSFAVVAAAVWVFRARNSKNVGQAKAVEPSAILLEYLERDRQYLVYVGVPCSQPTQWVRVQRIEGTEVVCDNEERHPLNEVQSWIVAYPNGEILERVNAFGPLPEGLGGVESGTVLNPDALRTADLAEGAGFVVVNHGQKRRSPAGKFVYATSLTNVGAEPVQILKFAGYAMVDGQWQVHTVSGSYYTGEQFRAWYGLGETEWVEPGQTVSDPDNYGGPKAIWAYFCRTKSGRKFVTGAEVTH